MAKRRVIDLVDRYDWIAAFGILFPALIAVIVVALLLTGSTYVIFVVATIFSVGANRTKKGLAARLRARRRASS